MKQHTLFAISISCFFNFALGAAADSSSDHLHPDLAKVLPDCTLIEPTANDTQNSRSQYAFECDKDESFTPTPNIAQCVTDPNSKQVMDCLYLIDNKAPTSLKVTCSEKDGSWTKHASKDAWVCTIGAPEIPGCHFVNNNIDTGFYEYDCNTTSRLTGTSAHGKCATGQLNEDSTAYYCLAAEHPSDLRVMLKCSSTWIPDPLQPGGFICGTKPQKK